jgi:hypothetical protein
MALHSTMLCLVNPLNSAPNGSPYRRGRQLRKPQRQFLCQGEGIGEPCWEKRRNALPGQRFSPRPLER